jgi:hypothetical protein
MMAGWRRLVAWLLHGRGSHRPAPDRFARRTSAINMVGFF